MTFIWPDTAIELALIALLALLVRGLLRRVIGRAINRAAERADNRTADLGRRAASVLARAGGLNAERQAHRTRTIGTMLGSLVDALLVIVVVFMMLQTLGINIVPALASAGIGGIAIGFGAQSLVKDLISGVFLMMEDQFGVGDHVDIGTLNGTVQSVGLRVTRVQDVNGEIWYVRNGEIITLGNRSQGWSTANINIPTSLSEDPAKVLKVLGDACQSLEDDPEWHDVMLEPPKVLGLTGFDQNQANYLVVAKCLANQQWGVERELRARAVAAFRQAGVSAPSQLFESREVASGAPDATDRPTAPKGPDSDALG